ncbi:MAG: leucine-rich repeat domain-containing protein [Clostridium sp.]|nr:leucine-rich repeat domain-containing protein [Clostridium sp.]
MAEKNIKKWKAVIIVLLGCIVGFMNTEMSAVKAETFGDYSYSLINNEAEVEITRYYGSGSDTEIQIPSEIEGKPVTSIGIGAFSGCSGLTEITILESVTSIGNNAFSRCSGLTNIELPNGLKTIGWGAFSSCSGLINMTLPDSLEEIGWAFADTGLSEIKIGKALPLLARYGSGMDKVSTITLTESAEEMNADSFAQFKSLSEIKLDNENANYTVELGVLFNKDMTSLIYFPAEHADKQYHIPESVINIEENAFLNNESLEAMVIPEHVKFIGNSAFSNCKNLNTITVPGSVAALGRSVFSDCTNLEEVILQEGIKTIGESAFNNCSKLDSLVLPDSLESIQARVFAGCAGLKSVTLGNGLASIPGDVLRDTNLEEIVLSEDNENFLLEDGVLFNKAKTTLLFCLVGTIGTSYDVPEGITNIGSFAFSKAEKLESIVLPKSVRQVAYQALSGCNALRTVTFLRVNDLYISDMLTDITIKGYTDSEAQKYAANNNLKFETLGEYVCEQHEISTTRPSYSYILAATCTSPGIWQYTCALCGELVEEETPALEHSWSGTYRYVKRPTCIEKGTEAVFCIRCGSIKEDSLREVEMTEHTEVEDEEVEATCTTPGKTIGSHCDVCGIILVEQEEIPALGTHGDTEIRNAKEATETADGYTGDVYCKICGEKLQDGNVIKAAKPDATQPIPPDTTEQETTEKPEITGQPQTLPEVGKVETDTASNAVIKVTNPGKVVDGKVTGAQAEYAKPSESSAKAVVPETVTIDGISYEVTSIAANAFKNDKKLTQITIGSSVKSVGANAFSGCKKLKKVTIGKEVTDIGESVFSGCTKLKTVSMGKNVTAIGAKAFYKCTALTKITLPAAVRKIGKQAFYGCKKLKTVTIKTDKLTSKMVGSKAFKGIHPKATVKVPKKKLAAYKKLLKKKGIGTKVKIKK